MHIIAHSKQGRGSAHGRCLSLWRWIVRCRRQSTYSILSVRGDSDRDKISELLALAKTLRVAPESEAKGWRMLLPLHRINGRAFGECVWMYVNVCVCPDTKTRYSTMIHLLWRLGLKSHQGWSSAKVPFHDGSTWHLEKSKPFMTSGKPQHPFLGVSISDSVSLWDRHTTILMLASVYLLIDTLGQRWEINHQFLWYSTGGDQIRPHNWIFSVRVRNCLGKQKRKNVKEDQPDTQTEVCNI